MEVYGTSVTKVSIDPLDVLKKITVGIHKDGWIVERDGKYIEREEVSAGQHSFDHDVGEVSKHTYELYKAKNLLIGYLENAAKYKK